VLPGDSSGGTHLRSANFLLVQDFDGQSGPSSAMDLIGLFPHDDGGSSCVEARFMRVRAKVSATSAMMRPFERPFSPAAVSIGKSQRQGQVDVLSFLLSVLYVVRFKDWRPAALPEAGLEDSRAWASRHEAGEVCSFL